MADSEPSPAEQCVRESASKVWSDEGLSRLRARGACIGIRTWADFTKHPEIDNFGYGKRCGWEQWEGVDCTLMNRAVQRVNILQRRSLCVSEADDAVTHSTLHTCSLFLHSAVTPAMAVLDSAPLRESVQWVTVIRCSRPLCPR